VLAREWGADWRRRFKRFEPTPMAAASIGQVHRAVTKDGRDLAIKVQYPGVRGSIDADIDNVATLLRVSGLLPKELDIGPLLEEAKHQLADEADYHREGEQMTRYGALLAGETDYVVPKLDAEFSTGQVLAMDYLAGVPIESLVDADQGERNRVMTALLSLVLRELFEFGVMQTDPNFANYGYQPESGRLVLLDFGAARPVLPETSAAYRRLIEAALAGNREEVKAAALDAGFVGEGAVARHGERIDLMIDVVLAKLNEPGPFDFGNRGFVELLREPGTAVASDSAAWHIPPAAILFVQRKISGTALLAARLGAEVDVRAMVAGQFGIVA
jgi:predicted unusual protein kinase regulating ubiquinone biosynthesis (AarF/ABC1/UbiB family)